MILSTITRSLFDLFQAFESCCVRLDWIDVFDTWITYRVPSQFRRPEWLLIFFSISICQWSIRRAVINDCVKFWMRLREINVCLKDPKNERLINCQRLKWNWVLCVSFSECADTQSIPTNIKEHSYTNGKRLLPTFLSNTIRRLHNLLFPRGMNKHFDHYEYFAKFVGVTAAGRRQCKKQKKQPKSNKRVNAVPFAT